MLTSSHANLGTKFNFEICLRCFYFQIEWLTAGDCIAGMHEVVVTSRTLDAIRSASEQNRSLWRVSSTVIESNNNKSFLFTYL